MPEDVINYIEVFKKKFEGVTKRSPILIDFHITPEFLTVYHVKEKKVISFQLDYTKDVKEFIAVVRSEIRDKWFPRMIKQETVVVNPLAETLQKDINNGYSFDEAFKRNSKFTEVTEFFIDKVDFKKNRIILIEVEKPDNWYIYELNIPVILFIKKVRKKEIPKRWSFFDKFVTYKGGHA